VLQPALAAPPITGVTVSPATATVSSGAAVYLRAAVQGTGDFDHRVNWSLSPGNAGSISPTGLFISAPAFTGPATVTATSVENSTFSGAAAITVSAGGGVVHVDRNNLAGAEDGSALHPYRTIQGAIGHGETIKVAQGTYTESVGLPGTSGVLILGGFKGGSAEDYADNHPGDFITRSTDHITQVTTIQSPDRNTLPVVTLGNWSPPTALTYAVDGFTLTGGFSGLELRGNGPVHCFISQNLITDNGPVTPVTYDRGGGIRAEGVNTLVLNNHIVNNQTDWGGGFFIDAMANSFLVQGNLIENNRALGGLGHGGGALAVNNSPGQAPSLFTWNVVRGNRAGDLLNYGSAGGIGLDGGRLVELSHNIYANNQTKEQGAGVALAGMAVLRHELIYRNSNNSPYGGAGVNVQSGSSVTLEHCTITGNINAAEGIAGGLYVQEQSSVQVSNSIIWGNSGNQLYIYEGANFAMTYSDSQPYPGTGNISVDPLFAAPATDDYHLKSVRGRWDPALAQWVTDKVHSPCIDKGDPAAAFDQEPIPNRSRTNMGVYGNTPEASKSQAALEGVSQVLLLGD
jgi:hypothetical protein